MNPKKTLPQMVPGLTMDLILLHLQIADPRYLCHYLIFNHAGHPCPKPSPECRTQHSSKFGLFKNQITSEDEDEGQQPTIGPDQEVEKYGVSMKRKRATIEVSGG